MVLFISGVDTKNKCPQAILLNMGLYKYEVSECKFSIMS